MTIVEVLRALRPAAVARREQRGFALFLAQRGRGLGESVRLRSVTRSGAMVLAGIAIAACLSGIARAQEATGTIRARLLALPEVGQWLDGSTPKPNATRCATRI